MSLYNENTKLLVEGFIMLISALFNFVVANFCINFIFFCNFFVGLAFFCWVLVCFYVFIFFLLIFFFLVENFLLPAFFNFISLSFRNVQLVSMNLANLFFFFCFFEFFFFLVQVTEDLLKILNLSQVSWFLFFFCLFIKQMLVGSECVRKFFNDCFFFIYKRANLFFFLYFFFSLFFFFKNAYIVDQCCFSSSFHESLLVFCFLHFNTFFSIILFFFFILIKSSSDVNLVRAELTASVFFKLILLAVFIGIILNVLILFFLYFFFVWRSHTGVVLTGTIVIFQGCVAINVQKLFYTVLFSLIVFLFLMLIYFFLKEYLIEFSPEIMLRLNFVIIILQNAIFVESRAGLFLLLILFCYNLKFTILFFFKVLVYFLERLWLLLNTRVDFSFKRVRSLSGLTLMDFFNLRNITRPLNWVYIDEDKSVLVAEPTSEIILAAKLKSILSTSKTIVYLVVIGSSYASILLPFFISSCVDMHLTVSSKEVVSIKLFDLESGFYRPAWPDDSFKNKLELQFKLWSDALGNTPDNEVPMRKCHQLVPDKFDPATEEEALRRTMLAREGIIGSLFFIVVGELLLRLITRLIFGGGDDDDDDDYRGFGRLGADDDDDDFVQW